MHDGAGAPRRLLYGRYRPALIARYPDDTFFWLIGSDQALQLPRWKDIDELLQLVQIVVFSREDTSVPRSPYPLIYRPMRLVPISSTQIREGSGWRYLHPAVKGYISAHRLYLESFVKGHMSSRRYAHSVRVAQLSAQLAHAHHLDEGAAWEAGMLHDLCKEMPKAQMEIWMRQLFPQHLDEPAAIWHGYLGSVFASRLYGCQDKRVRCAIYHHVKGDCTQPYAMITYCADKLEPGRGYDSSEQIALCMRSLRRGFMRVKAEQSEYLKKEKNGAMKEKLEIILKAIGEKKGEDILVFAFSSLNPAVDEVVIASASNQRQVFALADNVKDRLAEHGMRVDHVEGGRDSRWILIDASDIIVHIFEHQERNVYGLEKLYADLPVSRYDL